jgi:hypothetical protein
MGGLTQREGWLTGGPYGCAGSRGSSVEREGTSQQVGSGLWIGWRVRPAKEEMFSKFHYSFSNQLRSRIKFGKILRSFRKYETFYGGRLEYLEQLLY